MSARIAPRCCRIWIAAARSNSTRCSAAVQEMGRIVDLDTPYIDCVLGLTQQMGRVAGVYPAFPDTATLTDAETSLAD